MSQFGNSFTSPYFGVSEMQKNLADQHAKIIKQSTRNAERFGTQKPTTTFPGIPTPDTTAPVHKRRTTAKKTKNRQTRTRRPSRLVRFFARLMLIVKLSAVLSIAALGVYAIILISMG